MVQAEAILSPTGLIAGSIEYPWPLRNKDAVLALYRKLRVLRPKALYYLTGETKLSRVLRHYLFFRLCGIQEIHGVPWQRDLRYPRELPAQGVWESEASRLLRCIGASTEPAAPPPADRDLGLSAEEKQSAAAALQDAIGLHDYIVISVGGKMAVKDWGDGNWAQFLEAFSRQHPDLGLVVVGSADERARTDLLAKAWQGPSYNSCGMLTPRGSAAVIARASLFAGHDTGTLHLAAAANRPIVGIYSARSLPGQWYSDRPSDIFIYNRVDCFGCLLNEVSECPHERRCITSITPNHVLAAANRQLSSGNRSLTASVDRHQH
jgi:ADP-heptose:LPS heptosyltransferase